MENGKCPHCGCYSLVKDLDATAKGLKYCWYCLLCGHRFKLSGDRYAPIEQGKRRLSRYGLKPY